MAKNREEREKIIIDAQKALDTAPGRGKSAYLRLPKEVKLFTPVKGKTYKLRFIPWKAGAHNKTFSKGQWGFVRYLQVHGFIGPDEISMVCSKSAYGTQCAVCDEFNRLKAAQPSRDDKSYWKNFLQPLRAQARSLYLVHDTEDKNEKNLYLFDWPVFTFDDAFRQMYQKRAAWMSFASMDEDGCIVEIDAKETKADTMSFTDLRGGILIERAGVSVSDYIYDMAKKLCLDDWIVETSYSRQAALLGVKNDDPENDDDDPPPEVETEEEEEVETPKPEKKTRGKKKDVPPPPPEPEDDDEDEPEDPSDLEEDDDSDIDEDSDDDDDDEPEPPKKSGKKK